MCPVVSYSCMQDASLVGKCPELDLWSHWNLPPPCHWNLFLRFISLKASSQSLEFHMYTLVSFFCSQSWIQKCVAQAISLYGCTVVKFCHKSRLCMTTIMWKPPHSRTFLLNLEQSSTFSSQIEGMDRMPTVQTDATSVDKDFWVRGYASTCENI